MFFGDFYYNNIGKVEAVHFTKAKVFYDLAIGKGNDETIIRDIDSAFVTEYNPERAQRAVEVDTAEEA
ncbi:hypothetical protein BH10BAC5_BH10BAC5_17100 [soil metagenome]